jgi:hypothetical protein
VLIEVQHWPAGGLALWVAFVALPTSFLAYGLASAASALVRRRWSFVGQKGWAEFELSPMNTRIAELVHSQTCLFERVQTHKSEKLSFRGAFGNTKRRAHIQWDFGPLVRRQGFALA